MLQYSLDQLLSQAEAAMEGIIRNLPSRGVAALVRILVLPLGRWLHGPSDALGTKVANLMLDNGPTLRRITAGLHNFEKYDPESYQAVLPKAYDAVVKAEGIEKKLRHMLRDGKFTEYSPAKRLKEAMEKGWITQEEYNLVDRGRKLKRAVLMVDDFDMELDHYDEHLLEREPV